MVTQRVLRQPKVIPFNIWLRRELQARGWTQADLARRLPASRGLSSRQSHVSKWLRNERRPSPQSCATIALALDLSLDEVLAYAGHRVLGSNGKVGSNGGAHNSSSTLRVGPIHDRLIDLITRTPEDRLEHLVPLFEWIYEQSLLPTDDE